MAAERTNVALAKDVSRRTRLGKPWHTSTISHGRCLQVVDRCEQKQHALNMISAADTSALRAELQSNAISQQCTYNIPIHLLVCLAPILISPLCCLSRFLGFTVHLHPRRVGRHQIRSMDVCHMQYHEVLGKAFQLDMYALTRCKFWC